MSTSILSRVWTAVRAPDWWAYKIPPLLATVYAGFIRFDHSLHAWAIAFGVLTSILLVAVYGYVLNDICDLEADRRSGRINRMARVGRAGRALGLLLPSSGALALGGVIGDPVILGLLALNLALPTFYSVPSVRLKGRGAWGALADAAGVHAVPMALVARAVTADAQGPEWATVLFVASSVGWAFCSGLRGIIVHQVADRRVDQLAGVSTSTATLGVEGSRRLVLHWLLPVELTCLAAFLALVLPAAVVAAIVVTLFAALEFARVAHGWILPVFEPAGESRERYLPIVNNELYEIWLPSAFALQLAVTYPLAWLLFAGQAILFYPNLRRGIAGLRRTLVRPRGSTENPLAAPASADFEVIIAATTWTVNGVNVFSANLARALLEAGVPAQVLLTEDQTNLVATSETMMPRPAGVPFRSFPLSRADGWGAHWGGMVRFLEEAAPCVYIPNSDWRHSAVCPRLSDNVVVVGIVHSDDPLHYDHVRRLAFYWNAVVAVSSAVARRTAELCPAVADRIVTIPIGVRIPIARPVRVWSGGSLRLIYHGTLKQHQKRVLDFPKIIQCALDLGVPVQLSIVGTGPDEAALRAAAGPLVDRGAIRFLGVSSPDDIATLLERHDVYLLASEFEGMPNALIEAMGRGCVPVVTRMTSGIPELIRDGDNGFMVPVGDISAFAECLLVLWNDPERRERMSISAFATVRHGGFRVEDMVEAYQRVFAHAWKEVRDGRFVRPPGPLSPPPPQVAGISLFPVALPHVELGLGAFPSIEDAEDYDLEVRATARRSNGERAKRADRIRAAASRVSLDGVTVFVSAPVWTCNGVNLWSEDLVRGLRDAGLDARLLLTEEATGLVRIDAPRLARPPDLPFDEIAINGNDNWGARWGAMLRTLEAASPCIYFPNYDWRHSCVVPALSKGVKVVGTLHDTGSLYTEHAARLGEYWNAVVATSYPIGRHIRRQLPRLETRLATIPHGLSFPAQLVDRPPPADGATSVLIVGAGNHGQDDGGWMEALALALACCGRGLDVVFVEPPQSRRAALSAAGARVLIELNRKEWFALCRTGHFVVADDLRDESRRLVFEAMGHGCVPVWVGSAQFDDRLIHDGDNGIVAVDGSGEVVTGRILELVRDPDEHRRMAARAHRAVRETEYGTDQMIDSYLDLFRRVMVEPVAGGFRRTRGPILPPPASVNGQSVFSFELNHRARSGMFPTEEDARRFREEARPRGGFPTLARLWR